MRTVRRSFSAIFLIFSFLMVSLFPGNMNFVRASEKESFLPVEKATTSINVKISLNEKQQLMELFGQDVKPDFSKYGVLEARPIGKGNGERSTLSQQKKETWWNLVIPKFADPQEYLDKIAAVPGVLTAEPNRTLTLFEVDPYLGYQWHLEDMNAPEGWSYLVEKNLPSGGRDEVIVAVIDSGVRITHEDLASSLWINQGETPGNGIDDDGNGYVDDTNGWNTYDNNNNVTDVNGHGTHVAGIIAAIKDNGAGVSGMAPNVKIMPIRASSSSGTLTSYSVTNAVYYALENGADVINMSFGGYYESLMEQEAYLLAKERAVLVAAAGNETKPTSSGFSYPAAYPFVLGVMATSKTPDSYGDLITYFSNWDTNPTDGWGYEVMAPGDNILSTLYSGDSSYGYKSGTSMATPVVAGVAALVKSLYYEDSTMDPQSIHNLIIETGIMKQGKTYGGTVYPYPFVDVEQALKGISKIQLNETEWTFSETGQSLALYPSIYPSQAVPELLWSTSDSTVATVSSAGEVSVAGPGQAVIRAKSVYGRVTAECAVSSTVDDEIAYVELETLPNRVVYVKGESLDVTGGTLLVHMLSGRELTVDLTSEMVSGYNSDEVGFQELTVQYQGKTTGFQVEVKDIELAGIEITRQPTKTTYYVGESLDLTGLEVTGTYNNGSTKIEEVTLNNVSGFDSSEAMSGQIVTVTLDGKTATFEVNIKAFELVRIEVTRQPSKVSYFVGEALDLTELEVTGTYINGSTRVEEITFDQISGFDSSEAMSGQIVTVTLDGKSATFEVDINAIELVRIEVTRQPSDVSYFVGETFILTGLEVTGTYNNGSTKVEVVTLDNLFGFDSSQPAEQQTVTVTIEGKSATFTVQIKEPVSIRYRTHVQKYGWQEFVADGAMSGTSGQALRLEGIEILVDSNLDLGVQYSTHIQNIGWQGYVADGAMSGTSGQALRLEAIKIELTGADKDQFDVYYRVHAEKFGWMDWAKNGNAAGTAGFAYRLEAIEIRIVEKGTDPGLPTATSYRSKNPVQNIRYRTHVQNIGWQDYVYDGAMSGTSGLALRLEGIEIEKIGDHLPTGSIEYTTHVQKIGWQDYVADGAMSGTIGLSLRLEAIRIRLSGTIEMEYDIYYRVHAQNFGWMGWTKNGEDAGTAGFGYRLEGIEILLVSKGEPAPGSTANAFVQK